MGKAARGKGLLAQIFFFFSFANKNTKPMERPQGEKHQIVKGGEGDRKACERRKKVGKKIAGDA